ncbi:MAG TPA: NADH-quinone oxidoreductase subunit NuoK [Fulvivirga sp.]|nr:NADH-quinone oxidoreductase subunit NuoK [Fulvivirga sp.]
MQIEFYFLISSFLFAIGLAIVVTRKNAILVLMGIELMLNAANINFVAISQSAPDVGAGQFFALFVIVVAAAEAAVGLAIVLRVYDYFKTIDLDNINELKG